MSKPSKRPNREERKAHKKVLAAQEALRSNGRHLSGAKRDFPIRPVPLRRWKRNVKAVKRPWRLRFRSLRDAADLAKTVQHQTILAK